MPEVDFGGEYQPARQSIERDPVENVCEVSTPRLIVRHAIPTATSEWTDRWKEIKETKKNICKFVYKLVFQYWWYSFIAYVDNTQKLTPSEYVDGDHGLPEQCLMFLPIVLFVSGGK